MSKYCQREKQINLLLLMLDNKYHYVWIKKLGALISHRSKHYGKQYICPHCIHPFWSEQSFMNHFTDCAKHNYQVTKYPTPDKSILKWKSRNACFGKSMENVRNRRNVELVMNPVKLKNVTS